MADTDQATAQDTSATFSRGAPSQVVDDKAQTVENTTVVDNSPEIVENSQQQASPVEARARDMGWVPLEEWQGDPEDHVSAKEFIRVGNLVNPLREKLKAAEAKLQENSKFLYEALKSQKQQLESQHKADLAAVEKKKETAFAAGDYAALKAAEAEEKLLVAERDRRMPPIPSENEPPPEITAVFREYEENYPGISANADAQAFVNFEIARAVEANRVPPSPEALRVIMARAAKNYGTPAPSKATPSVAVSPSARAASMGGVGKQAPKFSSLSEEDQQIFKHFQRAGRYPNTGNIDKDAESYIRDLNGDSLVSEFRRPKRR